MNEESIFHAVLQKNTPLERSAYLEGACGDDPALRQKIEGLLKAHEQTADFMEHPAVGREEAKTLLPSKEDQDKETESSGNDPLLGSLFADRYKIRERLGQGGMGTVYVADQIKPVQRRVALKLIRGDFASSSTLARFEQERQALALMDHPNIAKVLDAGIAIAGAGSRGTPYFVMELIKGVPITQYCDEAKLTPKERLALFSQVCQAVQHAHQKGIIHRDLKPSNILIGLYDGKPVPKIIDFGVAKATGPRISDKSVYTEMGSLVGTLEYMSPEQAVMNNLDIDTRTDIYALGIVLYELLTGMVPFSQKDFAQAGLVQMLMIIKEVEPPKPSTKLSGSGSLPSIAATRKLEPERLTKLIKGDLDWIVLKCLEKDRSRRYETANALSMDIQRYLADEIVLAGAPGAVYRLRKFLRRNKGSAIAACLVLTALLTGIISTTWQAIRAEQALVKEAKQRAVAEENERRANVAADKERAARLEEERQRKFAEAINQFVQDDFLALTSVEGQYRFGGAGKEGLSKETTLRELLDRAAEKLRTRKDLDPRSEAQLCFIVGVNYRGTGEARKGIEFLKRAVQLRTDLFGRDHADTLNAANSLAATYLSAGQIKLALPLAQETLELCKTKLGPEHPITLAGMNILASVYEADGQLDSALPLLEQTRKLRTDMLGRDDEDTLMSIANLAAAYRNARQLDKALPLLEETVKLRTAKLGHDHPDTLISMNNLALAYKDAGQPDNAFPLFEQALRLSTAKLGLDHPDTLLIMANLATGYRATGQLDKALPLLEQVLKLRTAKLGPDHPSTLISLDNLAVCYWSMKQLDKSIPLFEESLTRSEKKLGRQHPDTLQTAANLGVNYKDAGRLTAAIPLMEEAYRASKTHVNLRGIETPLLEAYLTAGRVADGAKLIEELLADARTQLPKDSLQLAALLAPWGQSLLQAKGFTEAEPLLRECLAIREKKAQNDWRTFNTQSVLGGALLGQKKYAEAEPFLLKGYEGMKQREKTIPLQGRTRIPEAVERLIQLYTETDKRDEEKKWQVEKAAWETKMKEQSKTPEPGKKP